MKRLSITSIALICPYIAFASLMLLLTFEAITNVIHPYGLPFVAFIGLIGLPPAFAFASLSLQGMGLRRVL